MTLYGVCLLCPYSFANSLAACEGPLALASLAGEQDQNQLLSRIQDAYRSILEQAQQGILTQEDLSLILQTKNYFELPTPGPSEKAQINVGLLALKNFVDTQVVDEKALHDHLQNTVHQMLRKIQDSERTKNRVQKERKKVRQFLDLPTSFDLHNISTLKLLESGHLLTVHSGTPTNVKLSEFPVKPPQGQQPLEPLKPLEVNVLSPPNEVWISNDSNYLVTDSGNGKAKIIDVMTPTQYFEVDFFPYFDIRFIWSYIEKAAFTYNSDRLILITTTEATSIRHKVLIVDIQSKSVLFESDSEENILFASGSLTIAPDDQWFAYINRLNGSLIVRATQDGQILAQSALELATPDDLRSAVLSISHDSQFLLVTNKSGIRLWSFKEARFVEDFKFKTNATDGETILEASFVPSSNKIILITTVNRGFTHETKLFDLDSKKTIGVFQAPAGTQLSSHFIFSNDSNYIVAMIGSIEHRPRSAPLYKREIGIWNANTTDFLGRLIGFSSQIPAKSAAIVKYNIRASENKSFLAIWNSETDSSPSIINLENELLAFEQERSK